MSIKNLFEQALLSDAGYADFWDTNINQVITDKTRVKTALQDQGFSPTQAQQFVDHWRIVSHQPNTDHGFSVTVFEALDENGNGEYHFAMRGTEFADFSSQSDWLDNLGDIGPDGIAIHQAIDLYNYYLRLTAAAWVFIFLHAQKYEPKKGHPDTALIPQSQPFFRFARNSLCSNNALIDPKNNRLCGRGIRGIKPVRITDHAKATCWKRAA